jgi:hypothetical protein
MLSCFAINFKNIELFFVFGCLYKQIFRKMRLNDSVLPENVLNEEE